VAYDKANVLRYNVIEKLNLGDFQLSQNYLFFYDKLEKANYYLEYVFVSFYKSLGIDELGA
jgi:aminopeptidase C